MTVFAMAVGAFVGWLCGVLLPRRIPEPWRFALAIILVVAAGACTGAVWP